MVSFTLKLAQIPIAVEALYEYSRSYCRDFICDEKAGYVITMTQADIDAERSRSPDELPHSDAYYEVLALYRRIAELLLKDDILLFHGAGISVGGNGVLFTAPSGTGKTTHIRLWQRMSEKCGADVTVVNGDKPLLLIQPGTVMLCGTPWRGKEKYGCNTIVPLRSVVLLNRGAENSISKITPAEALSELLRQSYHPAASRDFVRYLGLLNELTKSVDFYRLYCNMDISAAETAYNGIFGKK